MLMNSTVLQDTKLIHKNQLQFHKLKVTYLKQKLGKCVKKKKALNKFNKGIHYKPKYNTIETDKWKDTGVKLISCQNTHTSQITDCMLSLSHCQTVFHRNKFHCPKICMEPQNTLNTKEFEKRGEELRFFTFRLCYKAIVIKTECYFKKHWILIP